MHVYQLWNTYNNTHYKIEMYFAVKGTTSCEAKAMEVDSLFVSCKHFFR